MDYISRMATPSAYVLKHWREAATLILVSPSASQRQSKLSFVLTSNSKDQKEQSRYDNSKANHRLDKINQDYDVLMLKRSRRSKFMPSTYVYPGGVATDNDFSSDWLTLFQKLGEGFQQSLFTKLCVGSASSAPMFQRQRDSCFSIIPPELAFRINAIRETFEESGVLIASPVNQLKKISPKLSEHWSFSPSLSLSDSQTILQWRDRVNKDPNEFLTMCNELDIIPAVWTLYEWSNWLTPVTAEDTKATGRRFDTIFFICCLDHKPDAFEDSGETVDALWATPSSMLTSYYQNELNLGYPQIYEFTRMLNFQSHINLMNYVADREPERVDRWLTVAYLCENLILHLMPGDALYPKDPERNPILQSEKTFKELCLEYPHFHRVCQMRTSHSETDPRHPKPSYMCNINIGRGQISPVEGFDKQFNIRTSKL